MYYNCLDNSCFPEVIKYIQALLIHANLIQSCKPFHSEVMKIIHINIEEIDTTVATVKKSTC